MDVSLGMACIVARRWLAVSEPSPCVFDEIANGTVDAHLVLDEPDVVGFLDSRPVFPGHTLVIPRRHWAAIGDVPLEHLGLLLDAGRRVAASQRLALGAEGTFFGLNDVISQSVPHVHLHVVPRRRKDGLRGFFWPRTRYADDAEARAVALSLRDALVPPGAATLP
jgi:histidine triad (HIT) family protein